ncbi:MAG TPA: MucB/RseB C-terminal domain-containing protein [Candidatus Desulfobacillus sp.]|nr:MucB/RseB C-terminal domain-containing protein [Candidatus Desulfobacillus sp.]
MRRALFLLILGGVAAAAPPFADPQTEALVWLQKMASAAQRLSYTGIFTYQSGGNSETSRITHLVDATGQQERLEVLDGSPREVISTSAEVKCYLPDDKVVIVEKREDYKAFPALLPPSVGRLGEHYQIRLGGTARIAGLDSQQVILKPKDALRYGHQLWADAGSGLIVKARTINERGETVELFFFNQLQISENIDPGSLKPGFDTEGEAWRVHNARALQSLTAGKEWQFKASLPGFRKSAGMIRQSTSGQEATHFVFSDGLASISVFIEPLAGEKAEEGSYAAGAVNVYKRIAGRHLVTVLGEVPLETLKRLGRGVEPRRK